MGGCMNIFSTIMNLGAFYSLGSPRESSSPTLCRPASLPSPPPSFHLPLPPRSSSRSLPSQCHSAAQGGGVIAIDLSSYSPFPRHQRLRAPRGPDHTLPLPLPRDRDAFWGGRNAKWLRKRKVKGWTCEWRFGVENKPKES